MRVAVVTDIPGNQRAFHAVLRDLKQVAPDLVLRGGDLAFGGARPAEIVDEIRALGLAGVLGNTEELLWSEERLLEMASAHLKLAPLLGRLREMVGPMQARIGHERLHWLKRLPPVYAGDGFAVVHASPKDPWRAPMANATEEEIRNTYAELGVRTHSCFVRCLFGTGARLRSSQFANFSLLQPKEDNNVRV